MHTLALATLLAIVPTVDINIPGTPNVQQYSYQNTEGQTQDFVAAFAALRMQNPSADIYVIVKGRSYDHIIDIVPGPNGQLITLVLGGHPTPQSVVVKGLDVEELGIRSSHHNPVKLFFPDTNPPAEPPHGP